MSTNVTTLDVADDGTITIPVDLVRAMGLNPRQTVTVEAHPESLVLMPTRQDRLNRIGQLLRTALSGLEQSEIEAGRGDRCF
jgi:antitoxin component of MazEF toxin-antitoxin module